MSDEEQEVHILDRGSRIALVLHRGNLAQLHKKCRLLTKDLSLALVEETPSREYMDRMDETLSIIYENIETHLEARSHDSPGTVISRATSNVSEPSKRSDSLKTILHQRSRDLKIQEEDSETERLERALLENHKKRVERQRQLRRLRDEAELESASHSDDEGTVFSSVSKSKLKVVAESHDCVVQTDSWIDDRKEVVQPLSAFNPLIGLLPKH